MNTSDWSIEKMIEVQLLDPECFLKIKETLTRIGTISKDDMQVLNQLCHILHKKGKYYIVHYKEMYAIDRCKTELYESDLARRNTIINLLVQWNLIRVHPDQLLVFSDLSQIKVVTFKDKAKWILRPKFTFRTDNS
jgi:hypothetical protein